MRSLLIFSPIIMLSACASMSKEECLTADWRAIGYEDGAYGAPVSAISPRRQACAKKIGEAPDMEAYLAGRRDGLRSYCTPSNGFTVGARGATYNGVCEETEARPFLAAYQTGQRLYQLESTIVTVEDLLGEKQSDLWNVSRDITRTESALASPETPHVDRIAYVLELKGLIEERHQIKDDIAALELDLARAEHALADYHDFLLAEGGLPGGVILPTRASY